MPTWWQSILRPFRRIRTVNQAYSLGGSRTENLRQWDRQDEDRKQLIVLVHGFDSGKDTAWGQFPALLMDDRDFTDFNLHRFGYPTSIVGQVSDIQNEGELLASFLKETLEPYRSTVLVGHSIGGLVILHALLSLEGLDSELLMDKDLKVLTFGTPFSGVQTTAVFKVLFNAQISDVEVLKKDLIRLKQKWEQKFNRIPQPGRITPQVPLYAYYGSEDGFVLQASACGGPAKECEPVDGDHTTMVKPLDRDHLAYKKLRSKALGAAPKVKPTAQGRIGVWVARVLGDNEIRGAQGNIVENLRTHIAREQELKHVVEIRELPLSIAGSTDDEERIEAERLGEQYNAAVFVWGKITGVSRDQFHPRVMLVAQAGSEPLRLYQETSLQQGQLSTPPGTVGLPLMSIREPLQLARFVIALTFFEQKRWADAARHFEIFIENGLSSAIKIPDVYFYAGFASYNTHELTGKAEPLAKAKEAYVKAVAGYKQEGNWDWYARVQNDLGSTYRALAERGVHPEHNLKLAAETLQEAARLYDDQQNWALYATVQSNLGRTYRALAERGVHPEQNLKLSAEALQEAARLAKEQQNWVDYAMVQNNLGGTYHALAKRGVMPEHNLKLAAETLQEAARLAKDQQNWALYATVQSNLGRTYRALAERGMDPEHNLKLMAEAVQEAARHKE